MNSNDMSYNLEKKCACGYCTFKRSNWSTHQKRCKLIESSDKELISTLKEQLEAKDQQLASKDEQMKAKDRQIEELIKVAKKPRTVNNTTNNNKYVVEQHINVFGKESIEHISYEQMQALLADPANAVPQFIKLKHRKAPGGVNQNLRVPNQKRAIYQVVVAGENGEKEWENKAKGEALEELYDTNSGHLEAEADEDTQVGSRFLDHQDRVKSSAGGQDGGRCYKEQLDKMCC
jgi:hypothetical protein